MGTAYGLNAAAVAERALGQHELSLQAHAEAIELLAKVEDQWGLAICKVLQARTLFDQHAGRPAGRQRRRRPCAPGAGDLHVLGIALTQIAQLAIADRDASTAVAAAVEALDLQERIGYTEGTVSALHVLGQAQQLGGNIEAARVCHRRGGVASGSDTRLRCARPWRTLPAPKHTSSRRSPPRSCAQRALKRDARGIPLRQRDAEDLVALEMTLPATDSIRTDDRPFALLVAELTA